MVQESNLIVPSRRGFLRGLGAAAGLALAAPAIVKAESLMRVRGLVLEPGVSLQKIINYDLSAAVEISRLDVLYGHYHVRPEWTVSLDEYSEKILAPIANELAEKIAASVMNGTSDGLLGLLGHDGRDFMSANPLLD